jgi:F420H(2)-dependent quinone reductase
VPTPQADSPIWKLVDVATRLHVLAMRASGGRIGGRLGKSKVLVLHHVGRKSGDSRQTPLFYEQDGDRLVLIASKGGIDTHPAWFHNLMAMDTVDVELPGGERRQVRPRIADGEERERLWRLMTDHYPSYDDYQRQTARRIPVVVLEPAG